MFRKHKQSVTATARCICLPQNRKLPFLICLIWLLIQILKDAIAYKYNCIPEGVDRGTQSVLPKSKETFQVPQALGSPETLSALLTAVISGDALSKAVS